MGVAPAANSFGALTLTHVEKMPGPQEFYLLTLLFKLLKHAAFRTDEDESQLYTAQKRKNIGVPLSQTIIQAPPEKICTNMHTERQLVIAVLEREVADIL